jgi:tetratricopeptide (TPR) repeat protein
MGRWAPALTLASRGWVSKLPNPTPAVDLKETRLPNATQLGRIDTLLQQAADYRARGQVGAAFKALEEARALAERSQDKAHQALVLCGLSDGYLLARRLEEARRYAEEGVAVARQTAIPTLLATAFNHLGNALMASQRYPEALQAYAEGSARAERSADPALAVTLLTNAIHAHLANGSAQEAISRLQTALTKTLAVRVPR